MSKGNLFLSQARGKVGSVVFAVTKGQQITRVYNAKPANPRSYAQQSQRALLANMTKFYKRATANFYRFAFEDKTTRESDYNAFARNNIKRGGYLTKEQFESVGFPAIGRYMMTKGSLAANIEYGWMGDFFGINTKDNTLTTLGKLSAWLLATQPALEAGDIVTFVAAKSDLNLSFATPADMPTWSISQFYIDTNDTRPLSAVGLEMDDDAGGSNNVNIGFSLDGTTSVSMGSVCVTRKSIGGLKVTDSFLVLSPLGQAACDWLSGEYVRREAAVSWGGNPDAILAGGQISTLPEVTTITFANVTSAAFTRRDLAPASSAGITVAIAGTNLKNTAAGGSLVMKVYDADIIADNTTGIMSLSKVSELTMTGTSELLQSTIPLSVAQVDTYAFSQSFYSLELDGVVIAYGAYIQSV